jgi:hypothetical protein
MVVIMYTPPRYASPAGGCEKDGTTPISRPPADLDAYREVIRSVQAEADRAGVDIPYWSPWNEPNHPYFMSPQRARCDASAPSAAVPAYAGLARAMLAELREGQSLVLGELAATPEPRPLATGMTEFVDALPRDVVCAAPVFGVHEYAPDTDGDPIAPLTGALDAFGCEREHRIWVTETGAKTNRLTPDAACRADRADLERWADDPRVDAVFHYTLREDDQFPSGLVTTDLTEAYPALAEWQAWGGSDQRPESTCP